MFARIFASLQLAFVTMVLFAPFAEGHFRACNSVDVFFVGIISLGSVFLLAWAMLLSLLQFAPNDVVHEFVYGGQ
jgi:hypothetical protein